MNIVLIASEGYPFKFSANNAKCEFIARGLQDKGCKVTIMDNPFGTKGNYTLQTGVSNTNIPYYIFPRKGKYSVLFKNIPLLWKALKKEKDIEKNNFVIIGLELYPAFLILIVITHLLGYKRLALYHEWDIGYPYKSILLRIEAWVKDQTFGYLLNGILPISHFLQEKSLKFRKPIFILPILSIYNRRIKQSSKKNHFTFCGHVEYLMRNNIILKAFKTIHNTNPEIKLVLILVGTPSLFQKFNQILNDLNIAEAVIIKNQIGQKELYDIYDESIGLLIPLDPNNIRDQARFSQKIAEYVGSKRPIITNSVGEIPYYFIHNESAVIIDYTELAFTEAMLYLIEHPTIADKIGLGGFNVGIKNFEYASNGQNLIDFINTIK